MKTIEEKFQEYAVVPVVVLEDAKDALPLAKALIEGGLQLCEELGCAGAGRGRQTARHGL